MRNLLQSLVLAVAVFVVAGLLTSSWVAGIAPALLAGGVLYFVLARRSFKAFEAIVTEAMGILAGAQSNPAKIDEAKALLHTALPLGRDQFLITEQVHGQLGQLAYSQNRLDEAREHLSKAWSRDWASQCTLAALDHRQKKSADGLARLEKASGAGSDQAIFWAVYAWVAKDSGDEKKALEVLDRGLSSKAGSAPLKAWQEALANKRTVDLLAFGPQWFQFFPEHVQRLSRAQQIQLMQAAGQPVPPQAERPAAPQPQAPGPNRAQRRASEQGRAPTPTIPHPRR